MACAEPLAGVPLRLLLTSTFGTRHASFTGWWLATGNVMRKTVPLPGVLSQVIVPP